MLLISVLTPTHLYSYLESVLEVLAVQLATGMVIVHDDCLSSFDTRMAY